MMQTLTMEINLILGLFAIVGAVGGFIVKLFKLYGDINDRLKQALLVANENRGLIDKLAAAESIEKLRQEMTRQHRETNGKIENLTREIHQAMILMERRVARIEGRGDMEYSK